MASKLHISNGVLQQILQEMKYLYLVMLRTRTMKLKNYLMRLIVLMVVVDLVQQLKEVILLLI